MNKDVTIEILKSQIKDHEQQIKIQYQQILHLQQDVKRLNIILNTKEVAE